MVDYVLAHVFVPHYSNNHRARILHPQVLFLITISLFVFQILFNNVGSQVGILGYAANISPAEVITLTNQKRAESGLASLTYSQSLTNAARAKGEHMLAYDYWAHIAPDGTEPWKFFTDSGYSYKYAGENLARDFSNPESAVNAWMASPTHKENLLSPKYSEIGIAVVEGDLSGVDTTIIVQLFGTSLSGGNQPVPIAKASEVNDTVTTPIAVATPNIPTATSVPSSSVTPTPSLVLTPTGLPTVTSTPTQSPNLIASSDTSGGTSSSRHFISPFLTTRGISIAVTLILIVVFAIDLVYVSYRKIPRVHGKTFAHLAFLGMVLAIVLVVKAGNIL